MKIESIRLKNFKAFQDAELTDLPNFCVVKQQTKISADRDGKTIFKTNGRRSREIKLFLTSVNKEKNIGHTGQRPQKKFLKAPTRNSEAAWPASCFPMFQITPRNSLKSARKNMSAMQRGFAATSESFWNG